MLHQKRFMFEIHVAFAVLFMKVVIWYEYSEKVVSKRINVRKLLMLVEL